MSAGSYIPEKFLASVAAMLYLFAIFNESPAFAEIAIPTGVFVALDGPALGSGIDSASNKHTTWAHNPLDGRLYSMGGDFTSSFGAPDSYQQEQYSLSIAERWANRANRNAGWRLEYPYCGPDGGVQPKSPDFIGWTWDSSRSVFWFVCGTCVIPVSAVCPDRTVSTNDDPKYKFRNFMTFNPAASIQTAKWTDRGNDNTGDRGENWMTVYDPATDTLIRFGLNQVVDIFNAGVTPITWTTLGTGTNAVGGTVRIYGEALSPDFVNRVIYAVDGTASRLMRWNMDSRTLSDLGPTPDGPVTPISNSYTVWDSVNRVLLFWHFNANRLHVYHPTTAIWETPAFITDPPGLTPDVRHAMVFDPFNNVMAMLGNTSSQGGTPNPRIFLYRYAQGTAPPSPTPPSPPANLQIR